MKYACHFILNLIINCEYREEKCGKDVNSQVRDSRDGLKYMEREAGKEDSAMINFLREQNRREIYEADVCLKYFKKT